MERSDDAARGGDVGTDETLPPSGQESTLGGAAGVTALGSIETASTDSPDYSTLGAIDPAHYVRGEQIAAGGFGRIIAARDRRLGRAVAIKELRAPTPALRGRFEREARITARLEHPSVVSIHEAGTWPNGEPFYAMRLVPGTSLDRVVADRTSLPDRLGLVPSVIAAVDAMAYAHSQRVIHRDLKPHNVLIGEFGETVVIDWGLAKDLAAATGDDAGETSYERTGDATVAGSVMGTPAYMPPEQARGDAVDERADVYALGAILYHVLAGRAPYKGPSAEAIIAAVLAGPPVPIERVVPDVSPDLATIVGKALAREREDRYPTARELAADLKRFQTGQLVGAHRYSLGQLARRWVRRHRAPVAVGAMAVTALAVVGVISVRRIVAEEHRAEAQRAIADQRRADAEELLGFMLFDLRDKLEPLGKLELLASPAAKAVDYFARRPATTVTERRMRARALANIGDVLLDEGDTTGALAQFRAALALREQVAGDDRSPATRAELAQGHTQVAGALAVRGDLAAAQAEYRVAVALREPDRAATAPTAARHDLASSEIRLGNALVDGGDLPGALTEYNSARDILDALAAAAPGDPQIGGSLAKCNQDIGRVLMRQGKVEAALASYRSAVGDLETINARHPDDTGIKHDLGIAHAMTGQALMAGGDLPTATRELELAVSVAQQLVAVDPTNTAWARDLEIGKLSVGDARFGQGDLPGALAAYGEAEAVAQRLAALDPGNATWRGDLAAASISVGDALKAKSDLTGALVRYRAAVSAQEAIVTLDPRSTDAQRDASIAHDRIAEILIATGDTPAALAEYQASLAIAERLAASDPSNAMWQADLAESHDNVASTQLQLHDLDGALAGSTKALTMRTELAHRNPDDTDAQRWVTVAHNRLGDVLLERGDTGGALREYGAALANAGPLAEADPTNAEWVADLAMTHRNLGDVQARLHHPSEAAAAYREALAIGQRLAKDDPDDPRAAALVTEVRARVRACCR